MIINDIVTTEVTCRRTIELDGPMVKTKFSHQGGKVKFKVDTIKLVWHDDVPPEYCHVFGYTKKGRHAKRPYRLATAPKWLKEALNA